MTVAPLPIFALAYPGFPAGRLPGFRIDLADSRRARVTWPGRPRSPGNLTALGPVANPIAVQRAPVDVQT